jgi:hypothetical protein
MAALCVHLSKIPFDLGAQMIARELARLQNAFVKDQTRLSSLLNALEGSLNGDVLISVLLGSPAPSQDLEKLVGDQNRTVNEALILAFSPSSDPDFRIVVRGGKYHDAAIIRCHSQLLALRWPYFSSTRRARLCEQREMQLVLPAVGEAGGIHPIAVAAIVEILQTGRLGTQIKRRITPLVAASLLAVRGLYLNPELFEASSSKAQPEHSNQASGSSKEICDSFAGLICFAIHKVKSDLSIDDYGIVWNIAGQVDVVGDAVLSFAANHMDDILASSNLRNAFLSLPRQVVMCVAQALVDDMVAYCQGTWVAVGRLLMRIMEQRDECDDWENGMATLVDKLKFLKRKYKGVPYWEWIPRAAPNSMASQSSSPSPSSHQTYVRIPDHFNKSMLPKFDFCSFFFPIFSLSPKHELHAILYDDFLTLLCYCNNSTIF